MTPFSKLVRNLAEWFLGRYREGPEAPERVYEAALDFAAHHPRATRAEWANFAGELAAQAYREGYIRGYEYTERTDDWRTDLPPEVVADFHDPDWRGSPPVDLTGMNEPVLEEPETDADVLRRQVEEVVISTTRSR